MPGIGQTPRYERFPAPAAGDDEAVVTVCAAALKPSDRFMAAGVHYAPAAFPQVAGLDGVGRQQNGERVAFMIPQRPFGGMAEKTLVRRGMWHRVADDVDDAGRNQRVLDELLAAGTDAAVRVDRHTRS